MSTILALTADDGVRPWLVTALGKRRGTHVVSVTSLDETLERLDLHPIDAVVACLDPAEANGDTRHVLSVIGRRFPVIIAEEQPARTGYFNNCDHVGLPCSSSALIWAIDQALQRPENMERSTGYARRAPRVSLELQIDNDKSRVSAVTGLLVEQAQQLGWFEGHDQSRIRVALEEALINAIVHGNLEVSSTLREEHHDAFESTIAARLTDPRYSQRRVRVSMSGDESQVRWTVADEGPGFRLSDVPDPRQPNRRILLSGRGILLMNSLMDRVTYNARGNQVELVKLNPAARLRRAAAEPSTTELACATS